ncbi:MAG: 4Fe-4S binding protein [Lachnospiraceae bacterium]|nr:4Fe-4S binding protein [Lachnospiraceae bacterium]
MKVKKKTTQYLRHLIQFLAFIVSPGLFILILSSIESIYKAILTGTFSLYGMAYPLVTLVAVIPITILWGRFFCGYLCAFGSMQDFLHFLSKKLRLPSPKLSEKKEKIFKGLKFLVLLTLFILWTCGLSLGNLSPWNVFGRYSSIQGWSDLSGFVSVGGLLLFLIIAASLTKERAFCRYLCPLGGLFTAVSAPRLFRVRREASCSHCGACSRSCPMGISVDCETDHYGKVRSGECIDCFQCVSNCALDALTSPSQGAAIGTVTALSIAGIYYAGNAFASSVNDNASSSVVTTSETISQTAKSDSPSSETAMPSGNMYESDAESSETIIVAVPSEEDTSLTNENVPFTDGIYEGSGQGYRGNTSVKVTVEEGKIVSITIESYADDKQFFDRAKSSIIGSILESQSIEVQAVSGATYSSNGIISAVANALGITYENTNLTNGMAEGHGKHGGRH